MEDFMENNMEVQCCFLVDATSSMGPYIAAAKREVRRIMQHLKDEHPRVEIEFGAVFYRDIGDREPIHVTQFTRNMEHLVSRITPIRAEGGGDIPEDVQAGFHTAMSQLDWHPFSLKHIFFITDAPPHGPDWHQPRMDDDHPGASVQLEVCIADIARMDVVLTILRITDQTEIMIHRMRTIYDRVGRVHNFHVDRLPERRRRDPNRVYDGGMGALLSGGVVDEDEDDIAPLGAALTRTVTMRVSDSIRASSGRYDEGYDSA